MNLKPILIHFHIHRRRTGVSSSVENVLPYFKSDFDTYLFGSNIEWEQTLQKASLKKLLKQNNQVVIHAHRNNELMRALWLRFLGYSFKLVATRHAATPPSGLTLKLLAKADKVISLTPEVKSQLPFPSTLIGHGVNTSLFFPKKGGTISGISQKNYILVAGRVRKNKGHEVFVDAVIPLLKNHPDWAAVIVGKIDESDFVKNLRAKIKLEGIENQVYFHGETRAIASYYQAATITVVPSYSEGFSLVCLEAMASGSITVATKNVGIHNKVIQEGETGFLFPAGDEKSLRAILMGIIEKSSALKPEKAVSYIDQNWSASHEAQQLKEVYFKLLKETL